MITRSASPAQRGQPLAYGEFFGIFESRHDVSGFSVASIVPDDIWMKGVKHDHQATHMIFVLQGHYVMSAGGQEAILPPRSLIFVPAGTIHANHPRSFSTRILTASISESQYEWAQECVDLPEAESSFRNVHVAMLGTRLATECARWCDASPLTAAGLCLELLAAAAKVTVTEERRPPRWLRAAKELLHDRCCEAVTIADVSEVAGVHPVHLTRTFRRFFHCTPGDYLRKCKIERAAALLRCTHSTIAEVASESGFSDQSHLSKAFRQALGVTPGEFRKNQSHYV